MATARGVSSVYSWSGRPSQKARATSRRSSTAVVTSGDRCCAARRAQSMAVLVLPPLVRLPEMPRSVMAIVCLLKFHRVVDVSGVSLVGLKPDLQPYVTVGRSGFSPMPSYHDAALRESL